MKKIILPLIALCFSVLYACGPAAEDRDVMKARAKVFQDSIANIIRTSIQEASAPAPRAVVMPVDTSKKLPAPGAPATK